MLCTFQMPLVSSFERAFFVLNSLLIQTHQISIIVIPGFIISLMYFLVCKREREKIKTAGSSKRCLTQDHNGSIALNSHLFEFKGYVV